MKIALGQIHTRPGRLAGNRAAILNILNAAEQANADLLVLPELSVPGYLTMDLTFHREFLQAQLSSLNEIIRRTGKTAVILGYLRPAEGGTTRPGGRPAVYNSAVLAQFGRAIGFWDKTLLPDYDVFDEHRYFVNGRGGGPVRIANRLIGVQICEDLWSEDYSIDPTERLCRDGAEIIVNISASPFEIGKFDQRLNLLRRSAQRHKRPIIYANTVGALDGYDGELIFDGRSLAIDAGGNPIASGPAFAEGLTLVDLDASSQAGNILMKPVEEVYSALIFGIREYAARFGFSAALVGLSGGIDSGVVAALGAAALGADKITGVSMPSKFSSAETKQDSRLLAENLGIRFREIPIDISFEAVLAGLRSVPDYSAMPENVAEENVQPRLRMINLFALSNKLGGLVLNTGNKTELALGYCTMYGDLTGGLGVLADVNKRMVYELAECINQKAGRHIIPRSMIEREPSAELRPDQRDRDGMGGSPTDISECVDRVIYGDDLNSLIQKYGTQLGEALVERLYRTVHRNEWKRRQAPPGIRVTGKAFGHGRRYPLSHEFPPDGD